MTLPVSTTPTDQAEVAREFMDTVFEGIKHGDWNHRDWLANALAAFHAPLAAVLASQAANLPGALILRSALLELLEATDIDPRDMPHHEYDAIVGGARERALNAISQTTGAQ